MFLTIGTAFAKINPEQYEQGFIKSEPCSKEQIFVHTRRYIGQITYPQLESDLENLKYILQTSYAGYEKACDLGLDIDQVISNIKEKFQGQTIIQSRDVAKTFYEETKNYIIDGHFKIFLVNEQIDFCQHQNVYFSDLFIEENQSNNVSSEQGILLPYYKDGKQMLRVATFSTEQVNDVTFTLNGKEQTLPVKKYPVDEPSFKPIYKERVTPLTAYIRLESFSHNNTKAAEINFQKFQSAGERFLNKRNVIVDLRTNTGGALHIGDNFVKNFLFDMNQIPQLSEELVNTAIFCKRADLEENCYRLITPATVQYDSTKIKWEKVNKRKYRNYVSLYDDVSIERNELYSKWMKSPSKIYIKTNYYTEKPPFVTYHKTPAFTGKMYILIDRNSCSATEEFVVFAKKCLGEENVILIGENSFGCIEFGYLYTYALKYSRLPFHVAAENDGPFMQQLSNWHGEGNGIYPDIWSTDYDLLDTLITITGDQDLREQLEGIVQ